MTPCTMDEIRALTGDDPVVRGVGGPWRGPAWHAGDAVAYTGLDAEGGIRVLVALGPSAGVADLVRSVRDAVPPEAQVIVPRGTPLPLAEPVEWNFHWTRHAPPRRPAEDAVAWEEDHEAVTALLRLAAPDSSVWPDHGTARRWAGIRADGRLVACLADTTVTAGVGHVSAIAVRPVDRGRALGSSITAWAARRLLEEGCELVTLGVYAGDAIAPRMYSGLGFTLGAALTTGVLKNGA